MEKIKFALEGCEEEVEFYVLEETRISGKLSFGDRERRRYGRFRGIHIKRSI